MKFKNIASVVAPVVLASLASGWDYSDGSDGPAHWSEEFSTCSGDQQSPIDVPDSSQFREGILNAELLNGFGFNYSEPVGGSTFELENLGKTIEIHVEEDGFKLTDAGNLAFLVGRSDSKEVNEYTLEQLHFHWGLNDAQGSEHTVAGAAYPMELHLVHFNSFMYESFSAAVASGNEDALLVVAVFFEPDESNSSTVLEQFLPVLHNENFTANTEFEIDEFSVASIVDDLGSEEGKFWLYAGGLTTPACNQIVTWVLMKEPVPVSEEVLVAFRGVIGNYDNGNGEVPIAPNFRPTQDLDGREVIDAETKTAAKILDTEEASATGVNIGMVALLASFLIMLL